MGTLSGLCLPLFLCGTGENWQSERTRDVMIVSMSIWSVVGVFPWIRGPSFKVVLLPRDVCPLTDGVLIVAMCRTH